MKSLLLSLLICSLAFAVDPVKEEQLQLAGRVHVIFQAKCEECHRPYKKKPSGGFGYVMDLKRVADNPDYITRGVPHESEIMRMVKDGDMPPSDQDKFLRLTPTEVNDVRRWIHAGAPSELPKVLPKLDKSKALPDPSALTPEQYAMKEKCRQKRITLDLKKQPASAIIAEMEKQSGIKITYHQPKPEPVLSIKVTNQPLLDSLEYLMLLGNFSMSFRADSARLGPNPPNELPTELPKVLPPNKRQGQK
jgi:mono/diheme cytochrome c family protein